MHNLAINRLVKTEELLDITQRYLRTHKKKKKHNKIFQDKTKKFISGNTA